MRTAPRFRVALLLPVLALGGACNFSGAAKSAGSGPAETPLLVVRVQSPERKDLDRTLDVTAEVAATRRTEVFSRIFGAQVLTVEKDVGARVADRELLATLDPIDLQRLAAEAAVVAASAAIKVREAELAVRELEAELVAQKRTVAQKLRTKTRSEQQAEKGAISEEDLETARWEFDKETSTAERLALQIDKAKVALDVAKKEQERVAFLSEKANADLSHLEIRAPFPGIISRRLVSSGQFTASTQTRQALFEIFDPESIVVETWLPQRDLRSVRAGQAARLTTDALPGLILASTVVLVSPVVEKTNGTVMARLAVDAKKTLALSENQAVLATPDGRAAAEGLTNGSALKPGLFVSGRIIVETREKVLTVPRKAIDYLSGRPFVFVATPLTDDPTRARVRRVWFEEGLGSEGVVEFVGKESGEQLSETDRIVVVGVDRLKDGDTVQFEAPAAPAGSKG